jgi:hypothetical protein
MVTAFEDALRELGLSDRADPATELVARKILPKGKNETLLACAIRS